MPRSSPRSPADLSTNLAGNNLLQIAQRLCLDPRAVAAGAGRLFTIHWPERFGLKPQPLTDFGIESAVRQGLSWSAWLLVPVVGIPSIRLATLCASRPTPPTFAPGHWTSYYVSFMTRERIIVAADEAVKIRPYNRVVDAHRSEAIRISRRPCPDGQQLTSAFWSCKP